MFLVAFQICYNKRYEFDCFSSFLYKKSIRLISQHLLTHVYINTISIFLLLYININLIYFFFISLIHNAKSTLKLPQMLLIHALLLICINNYIFTYFLIASSSNLKQVWNPFFGYVKIYLDVSMYIYIFFLILCMNKSKVQEQSY